MKLFWQLSSSLLLFLLMLTQANSAEDAPAFSAKQLTELPKENWTTNGGNLYNQRYSQLTEINRSNIKDLKAEWRTHLNGSGVGPPFSGEAQPIVYEGVIFIITGADDVFALDVETGEHLWVYEANLDRTIDTVCCGWTSRGVGLGEGKVYLGRLDGKLMALEQKTGKELWSVQAENWQEGYTITSAPLYYDGMVITGFAGAEFGSRGRVKAYNADTGKLIWTFYTVPGPGEPGFETWPQDTDAWKFGGGTVWQTPAVDPELGLMYFSTGNAGPDYDGSVRPGDNLFTASIVAIDAKTGEYRWHYQQVHHDIWDYDAPNPVVLFDVDYKGEPRKALANLAKTGWVYILDRLTGEPLIGIEEKPVAQDPRQATSLTQPFPIGDSTVPQYIDIAPEGYKLVNEGRIFTPFWDQEVVLKPSGIGGGNWPPSSYNPRAGLLYTCSNDLMGVFVRTHEQEPVAGEKYTNGRSGGTPIPLNGVFSAMDMTTNKVVWSQRWKDSCWSGSINTAGDLVFVGRNDGDLTALDSKTGDQLWNFQTGAGVNAPATTFEHKGKQKVVVYSAGNLFAGTPSGDSVWLFSLDGKMGPGRAPGADSMPSVAVEQANVEAGKTVYSTYCSSCHGNDGGGSHGVGPNITAITSANVVALAAIEGKGKMPAFKEILSDSQLRDVAVYVTQKLEPQKVEK